MRETDVNVIERAFQLAASCATVEEIKRVLRTEGYAQVDAHLTGPLIRRELTALLRKEQALRNEQALREDEAVRKNGAGGPTPAPTA